MIRPEPSRAAPSPQTRSKTAGHHRPHHGHKHRGRSPGKSSAYSTGSTGPACSASTTCTEGPTTTTEVNSIAHYAL